MLPSYNIHSIGAVCAIVYKNGVNMHHAVFYKGKALFHGIMHLLGNKMRIVEGNGAVSADFNIYVNLISKQPGF